MKSISEGKGFRYNVRSERPGITFTGPGWPLKFIIPANIFPEKTVLYGKVYFTTDRRAANCMGNFNEKNTILLVDDEQTVLKVGTLMIEELGYKSRSG